MKLRRFLFQSSLLSVAALGFVFALPVSAQDVAAPALKAGDMWTYRQIDEYANREVDRISRAVSSTGPRDIRVVTRSNDGHVLGEARFSSPGLLATGQLGGHATGTLEPALQLTPYPLREGETWSQNVRADASGQDERKTRISGKVVGWETVTVPAGEFRALRIERSFNLGDATAFQGATLLHETEWYSPQVKGPVKVRIFEDHDLQCDGPAGGMRAIYELVTFKSG